MSLSGIWKQVEEQVGREEMVTEKFQKFSYEWDD